jgi:hypothetical protein
MTFAYNDGSFRSLMSRACSTTETTGDAMVQSLSRWQAILLGIFVLAAVGLSIHGLLVLGEGHWPWNKSLNVRVGFKDVKGIAPGARVRIKGRDAGQVRAIDMPDEPDGEVVLVLRLDNRFRGLVRADAQAQIVSDGMFGGKVIEIDPGSAAKPAIADNAEIAAKPTKDLGDVVDQIGSLATALDGEKGKMAEVLKKTTSTLDSFQQVAEGIKDMPLIRGSVKDPYKILSPPGCDRKTWWFKQADLFTPGTDRLTSSGEQKLKDLARDLAELTKKDGAEIVVTAYSDSQGKDGGTVQQLTTNECLVVVEFLRKHKAVHKDWLLLEHKITPLGLGTERPPLDGESFPAGAGLGIVVFTPRSL